MRAACRRESAAAADKRLQLRQQGSAMDSDVGSDKMHDNGGREVARSQKRNGGGNDGWEFARMADGDTKWQQETETVARDNGRRGSGDDGLGG